MTARDLQPEVIAGDAGETLAAHRAAFGIVDKPIDSPLRRLHAWALVAIGGCLNMVRVDGVLYSWDTRPRQQKNGAVIGRVQAQRRGEIARDIGLYKIDRDGAVIHLPAELRAVLPGGACASSAGEGDAHVEC